MLARSPGLYASCIGEVATADGGGFRTIDDATVGRATTLLSDGTDAVLGMPTAFGLGFTGTADAAARAWGRGRSGTRGRAVRSASPMPTRGSASVT